MEGKDTETIAETLGSYYAKCFADHGASARGVDWHDSESLRLHYDKMLAVIRPNPPGQRISLLDIGCGYGGLLDRAKERGLDIDYAGIDLVGEMTAHGQRRHPDARFARAPFSPSSRNANSTMWWRTGC